MQLGESRSATGDDGLHVPFNNRPATPLKSKVWLSCINFCHDFAMTGNATTVGGNARFSPAKLFFRLS